MSTLTPRALRPTLHAALLACALALAGCGSLQRAHDAALLLADVQAGAADSALKRRTEPPAVRPLSYTIDGQAQVADLYQTADISRGSLVLIHGFSEWGRRDPRLVEFAHSLARSGFRVLAPELPGMTDMSVGSAERAQIAAALRFATRDGGSTGLAAMSLAAGPAVQAAMEADLAPRVSYIVLVGGYYDIVDVIRYATTGVETGGARGAVRQPVRAGKWMLLRSQLRHLERQEDRAALATLAELRLRDEQAPVHVLLERLSDQGRAVYDLIVNDDPRRVAPLIAQLPPGLRAELAALDLAQHDLTPLRTKLLLIHGANDPVIPLSQSRRLAAAVRDGQAELFVPPGLDHVDVEPDWRDAWELWRAARRLLALAEAR